MAFRLSLIAHGQGPTVGLLDAPAKAFTERVIAVLGARDFDIAVTGELRAHEGHGVTSGIECLVEAGGEEADLEALGAEHGLLGEGHALDGEKLLGVYGLVGGNEVGAEIGDVLEVFHADDGEVGGTEAVFAGVLG